MATLNAVGRDTAGGATLKVSRTTDTLQINSALRVEGSLDTVAAAALVLGGANATSVEIGDTGVTTDIQGPVTIEGSLDTAGAAALVLGGANATSVEIGDTGVTTDIQGPVTIEGGIDTAGASTLTLGAANATAIQIGDAGVPTDIEGDLQVQGDIDTIGASTLVIGGTAATAITLGASDITVSVPGSISIAGDLTVTGTTFTNQAETVLINDNHLYLNNAYTTAVAETGGLVVNYLPTATVETITAGGFTAGVDGVSDPTVTVTNASGTFSAGDLVQISGSTSNNGLFEVVSHTGSVVTVRSTANGVTNQVEDFTQNQFVTEAGTGEIRKVTVSVLRAGTDGAWETAFGSTTGLSFNDLATAAGSTLQSAYTAQGGTPITGSLALDFDLTGAISLDSTATIAIGGDADTGAINVGTAGARAIAIGSASATSANIDAVAFSVDGTSASNVSVTGAQLQLSTVTSGELDLTSAGLIDINASANLDIDVTGTYTMDSTGAFSVDGGAASNVTTSVGDLTVSATGASGRVVIESTTNSNIDALVFNATAGGMDFNSAKEFFVDSGGEIDLTSGGGSNIDLNASGSLTMDAVSSSNFTITSNSAGAQTLTLQATNAGAGTGVIDINADDLVTIDAASVSVDATSASNLTVTGADLTVSTVTSGALILTSAGLADVNAGANLDIDVTGTFDMLSTGAFSIDGTGASNVSATSGNLTLSAITSGDVVVSSVTDLSVTARGVTKTWSDASNTTFTGSISGQGSVFGALNSLASAVAAVPSSLELAVTSGGVAANDVVFFDPNNAGRVAPAEAGVEASSRVVGVATSAEVDGDPVQIQIAGVINMTSQSIAWDYGDEVYLSTAAGEVTKAGESGFPSSGDWLQLVGYSRTSGTTTSPSVYIDFRDRIQL